MAASERRHLGVQQIGSETVEAYGDQGQIQACEYLEQEWSDRHGTSEPEKPPGFGFRRLSIEMILLPHAGVYCRSRVSSSGVFAWESGRGESRSAKGEFGGGFHGYLVPFGDPGLRVGIGSKFALEIARKCRRPQRGAPRHFRTCAEASQPGYCAAPEPERPYRPVA